MKVLFEKRDLPVISLSISNPFGASFEESNIKGIAHFIEHLVFTGTKTRTHEDISKEIEKKGGILNAFTSHEITSFWFKLPAEHVFAGLDVLTDILNNPIFNEEKFEKEKKVILEEIKMYHDLPQRYVFEILEKNMFAKPFGESVIGNTETVSKLKRDFVYDYYLKNYNPGNFIITVVGNVDIKKICKYLEENFVSRKTNSQQKVIKKLNGKSVEKRKGIDQAHYLFGVHAPLPSTKEMYALEVLDAYLGNGMSSRLFLEIREARGLAYSVKGDISSEKNYSYYSIYVGTKKEAIPEVEKLILQELKNVKNISDKDLQQSKERLIGLKRLAAEDSSSVMNALLFSELSGKAEDYYEHEQNILSVKKEDVVKLAEKFLKDYSTAAIVPE